MKWNEGKMNKIAGLLYSAVGLFFILVIPSQIKNVGTDWYNSPRLFPYVCSGMLAVFGIWLVIDGIVLDKKVKKEDQDEHKTTKQQFKMVIGAFLIMAVYAALLPVFHYVPCTIGMLAGMMFWCGQRNYVKIGIISVVLPVIVYYSFKYLLYVRLP